MTRDEVIELVSKNEVDVFKDIRCIVCGNTDKGRFLKRYYKDNCLVVKCEACSFHFVPPYFRKAIDYTTYKSEEAVKEVEKSDVWIKIERNKLRYNLIKKYKKQGDILDIGCGFGHFMLTGHQLGYQVTGIEMSKANIQYVRDVLKLDVHEGNFLDINFDKQFDIISLWDVLEHIDNADEIIAQVSKLLKPGGIVILQVPQKDSFFAKLLQSNWWEMGVDHVNYFSHKTINQLFGQYGLQVSRIKSSLEIKNVFLYVIWPRLKRKKKNIKEWTNEDRQQEFNKITKKPMWMKKTLVLVHNMVYHMLSFFRIGDEMIVIGKKPE